MQTFSLINPLDMHVHLRQGKLLESVLPFSARNFSLALAMPNLSPPLMDVDSVLAYKQEILQCANAMCCQINDTQSESHKEYFSLQSYMQKIQYKDSKRTDSVAQDSKAHYFEPFMSIFVSDSLSIQELRKASHHGIKILKLYPQGSTTNSQNGMGEILTPSFLQLLEEAQKLGMILSIHGESAGFSMNREREFLVVFEELARSFPHLKIIIEHLSDRHSLESIHKYTNLFGTITLHHALLTLDDILGGMLNPFAFCKPIVKTPQDRDAILEAMLSADSKISFGSDSAPHSIDSKLKGAAGIFSAPVLLQVLATLFAKHNKLENLQDFISNNAMKIYDISLPFDKIITLQRCSQPFTPASFVACTLGDIAVFCPNFTLEYEISNIEIRVKESCKNIPSSMALELNP